MNVKRIQIKDLEIGMKIKSYDPLTKQICFKKVTDKWFSEVPVSKQRTLAFTNGVVLNCSENHPIMVFSDSGITEVFPDDLNREHIVITDAGFTRLDSIGTARNSPNYIDITVDNTHTFFAADSAEGDMVLTHNSQGGVRGGAATLHYPIWHLEVEDLLVLKNNQGTEANRIRHLDYSVQLNKVMYERLLTGGNITLFSPADVPEMYNAFFNDVDKFRVLYEQAEQNPKLRKKQIPALELFSQFLQERKNTGRIYLQNVDHCNDHSSFIKEVAPIRMSNLCLAGDTIVTVQLPDGDIKDMQIKEVVESGLQNIRVFSRNNKIGSDQFKPLLARGKTGIKRKVIRVTDTSGGQSIVCTPDHKIYTKNRGYVEAQHLQESDQLLLLN